MAAHEETGAGRAPRPALKDLVALETRRRNAIATARKAGSKMVGTCILAERGAPPQPRVSHASRTASGLLSLLHWLHRGPCDTDDADTWLDALMPFWAQLSRERGDGPGWARERAREHFPRLVAEHDEAWWLAREALERPRRGNGWNADAIAQHIGIQEHWLEGCFGPNKCKRCGLVSMQRPWHVREAERGAQKAARRKAKRTPRAEYEANSASRTRPWEAAGFKCRRTWERHGKPPVASGVSQVRHPTQTTVEGVTLTTSARAADPAVQNPRQKANTSSSRYYRRPGPETGAVRQVRPPTHTTVEGGIPVSTASATVPAVPSQEANLPPALGDGTRRPEFFLWLGRPGPSRNVHAGGAP
jgi:hypothetical protein